MIACLKNPIKVLSITVAVSTLALLAALVSQYIGGLAPCTLCLYQRIPFALVIALGALGLLLQKTEKVVRAMLALCALAFLVNTGIAAYHSGVERHWWESAVEGCKVPLNGENAGNWIDHIMNTPGVPCDAIAWADQLLGLSMANYNVLLNLALFGFCLLSLTSLRPRT